MRGARADAIRTLLNDPTSSTLLMDPAASCGARDLVYYVIAQQHIGTCGLEDIALRAALPIVQVVPERGVARSRVRGVNNLWVALASIPHQRRRK